MNLRTTALVMGSVSWLLACGPVEPNDSVGADDTGTQSSALNLPLLSPEGLTLIVTVMPPDVPDLAALKSKFKDRDIFMMPIYGAGPTERENNALADLRAAFPANRIFVLAAPSNLSATLRDVLRPTIQKVFLDHESSRYDNWQSSQAWTLSTLAAKKSLIVNAGFTPGVVPQGGNLLDDYPRWDYSDLGAVISYNVVQAQRYCHSWRMPQAADRLLAQYRAHGMNIRNAAMEISIASGADQAVSADHAFDCTVSAVTHGVFAVYLFGSDTVLLRSYLTQVRARWQN